MTDIRYIYTLNKKYIGQAINPWKRYDQHVRGEIKSTQDWIANLKQLPKLTILAKYDHDIKWQSNKHIYRYEQACVLIALQINWKLLYADLGWPLSRESNIKGGKIGGKIGGKLLAQWRKNNPQKAHQSAVKAGKAGRKKLTQWEKNNPEKARQRNIKAGKIGGRTVMATKLPDGRSKHAVKAGKAGIKGLAQWEKANPEKAHQNAIKAGRAGTQWRKDNPEKAWQNAIKGGKASAQWTKDNLKKAQQNASKGGKLGSHIRWHVNRNTINPNCLFCQIKEKEND